ncbi:hypothetical protein TDB9533_02627 [Thalassocella blandensis]|nr:hypothetical protein TDB9533_02627 [Thalassocella blandensis]
MKYIELTVRTAFIVHGYDDKNKEIVERLEDQPYMTKLIAINRIQSVSDKFILVNGSHGRIMYWEYQGNLAEIKKTFEQADMLVE